MDIWQQFLDGLFATGWLEFVAVVFGIASVVGVIAGSAAYALPAGKFRWEGFANFSDLRSQLLGAVLMGFGGMLAGGCAVGAGLSGAAVFTITSWVTLCAIWAAAALTDRLVDQRPARDLDQAMPGTRITV